MSAASSAPAFDYTGFKLGEKKTIKESEGEYTANLDKIRATLGNKDAAVTVDWPSFQAELTEESDRKFAGEYIYSRYLGSLAYALNELAEEKLIADVAANIDSFAFTVDKSGGDERVVLSVSGKTLTLAVSKTHMAYELDSRTIANFLKNNLRVLGSSQYAGFSLKASANWAAYENALTTATTRLQSQLAGASFKLDAASYLRLVSAEDAAFLGDYVYERFAGGVAETLAAMCEESGDYKDALTDAIKTVLLTADTAGEGEGENYTIVSLKGGVLTLGQTPSRLAYSYDGRKIKEFLEKNL